MAGVAWLRASGISGLVLGLLRAPDSEHLPACTRGPQAAPDSAPLSEWPNPRRPFPPRPPPPPPAWSPALRGTQPGTREPKRSDSATDSPAFLPWQVRAYVVCWGGGSRRLPLRLTESSQPESAPSRSPKKLCLDNSVSLPQTL